MGIRNFCNPKYLQLETLLSSQFSYELLYITIEVETISYSYNSFTKYIRTLPFRFKRTYFPIALP
nr:MAG TPA: protein of unknown function (DUF5338) [Caudoviricetes sp.]